MYESMFFHHCSFQMASWFNFPLNMLCIFYTTITSCSFYAFELSELLYIFYILQRTSADFFVHWLFLFSFEKTFFLCFNVFYINIYLSFLLINWCLKGTSGFNVECSSYLKKTTHSSRPNVANENITWFSFPSVGA